MSTYDDLLEADTVTNRYDALLESDAQEKSQRVQGNLAAASRKPMPSAEVVDIATKHRLPAEVVLRNIDELRAPRIDYDKLVAENPKLSTWLEDAANADLAHDDVEPLAGLERATSGRGFLRDSILDQLVGGFYDFRSRSTLFDAIDAADKARTAMPSVGELLNKNVAARLQTPEGQAEYARQQAARVPELVAESAEFAAKGQAIPHSPEVLAFLDENSGKSVWEAFKDAPVKIIAEVGARSGFAMLPGLAAGAALGVTGSVAGPGGATAGFATGMGAGSARVEYVNSVVDGLRKRGVNVTDPKALTAAVSDADLMADVQKEAVIRAAVIGGFDALAGLIGAKNLTPGLSNVVVRELANVGVQMPIQGVLGAAGEAGAELATGQELDERQIAAEFVGEFVTAPVDVAIAGFSGTRAQLAEGAAKVEAAQNRQRVFEAMASTDAKLRARAPERFRSLIEDMTRDGPVETVYIPADRFAGYFQDANQDAAELLDKMPGVKAQLEEALAAGTDLAIPMADFATHIAPSPHYAGLSQDLRFKPDDMTAREAEAWKSEAEALQKEAGKAAAEGGGEAQAPGDARVYADVLRQLTETVGMEEGTARRNATLMASVFGALGHRSGQDPYELYEKYGLKLERGQAKDAIREEARAIADDDNLLAPIIEELKAEAAAAPETSNDGIEKIETPVAEGSAQPTPTAAPERQPAPAIAAGPARGVGGGKGRVRIDDTYREVQWAVMDAATLAPTIDKAENQYRDRNRAAAQAQVRQIAQGIDFNLLADSPLMDYGAPTLAEDGRVVGGNGRLAGIRAAYDMGHGDRYKGPLAERAAEFGLTREDVEAMERPVLVRILPSDVDVRKAAIASNEGGALQMSALENAKVDAERIGSLQDFEFDDNGELAINRSLVGIRRWVQALPAQQRGAITDSQGALSAEGVRRVKNAILYRAYGDSPTLARLIDAVDPGSRNIAAALMRAAPAVAELKDGIASGNRFDLDISEDLEAAVEKLIRIRDSGQAVEEALGQGDMLGASLSEEAETILRFMAANLRSSRAIAEFLNRYHADAERAGSPQQGDMLGDRVTPKPAEMLARAAAAHEPAMELKASQAALFQAAPPVQSDAFAQWFGESKVVDEYGEPMVVYHATDADFDTFERTNDIGFHFGTAKQAEGRADELPDPRDPERQGFMTAPRTVPVYLSIKNPLRLPDLGTWEPHRVLEALQNTGVLTEEDADDYGDEVGIDQAYDILNRAGYDGIVYLNRGEGLQDIDPDDISNAGTDAQYRRLGAEDSYIAFKPEQIKSAIGNRGTFDQKSPNILEQGPAPKSWQDILRAWTPAETLTPAERGIEAKFMAWILEDPERAIREYESMDPETHGGEDTEGGKILNTDSARELSEDYRNDRSLSRAVHEPSSALVKAMFARRMAEPGTGIVLFSAGGTGAGKSSGLRRFANKMREEAELIYDTNMGGYRSGKEKIDLALASGREVKIAYTYRDPLEALEGGALARAARQETAFGSGRTVPLDEHLETHLGSNAAIPQYMAEYAENEKVAFTVIINEADREKSHVGDLDEVPQLGDFEYNSLREQAIQIVQRVAAAGGISAKVAAAFLQSEVPARRRAGRGDRGEPEKERGRRAQDRTPQELVADAIRDSGLDVNTATPQEIREALAESSFDQAQLFQSAAPVQSQAFQRWFGESKVVDENGEPLRVFHGTNADFDVFDPQPRFVSLDIGSHFGTADQADKAVRSYRDEALARNAAKAEVPPIYTGESKVLPVYLSIKNPLRIEDTDWTGQPLMLAANLNDAGVITEEELRFVDPELYQNPWREGSEAGALRAGHRKRLIEVLEAHGYDGLVYANKYEGTGDSWVTFRPEQVKSAIGNRGTFDRGSRSILHQAAYHGSPYDFDRFSTQHIGSGEGAQAYGWGLYFAESDKVAEGYAKNIVNMEKVGELNDRLKALVKIMDPYRTGEYGKFSDPRGAEAFAEYERVISEREKVINSPSGTLYQVEIDDAAVAKMMLYEAPMSAQPKTVLAALNVPTAAEAEALQDEYLKAYSAYEKGSANDKRKFKATNEHYEAWIEARNLRDMTGADYYNALAQEIGDEEASKQLAALGITGIKYRDANSRLSRPQWSAGADRSKYHSQVLSAAEEIMAETTDVGIAIKRLRATAEDARTVDENFEWAEIYEATAAALESGDLVIAKGSHNLVVFDDSIVEITAKNGKPVTKAQRAELMQGMEQTPRGATTFGDDRQFSIRLFETADLSTLLHESGHFYLEVLNDLAAKEPAIAKDFETLLAWFGVEGGIPAWNAMDLDAKRASHEQFARGFEAYLFEGKAPNVDLQGIFARFRAWLVSIYRNLERLNVKVTPAVRAVFDRLVATDEQIAAARSAQAYVDIFTTAEDAGMSETEFGAYRKAVAAARADAEEKLTQEVLAELTREQKAWWAEERAKVEAEVTAEAHAQPVYRALAFLQKHAEPDGTPLDGDPVKLNRAAIVDAKGKDFLKTLPRPYVYSAEGGVAPDVVATMFGFDSGDALLIALAAAKPARAAIADETDARMKAKFGDVLVDGSLTEKAMAAVHNDRQADLLAAELRGLRRLQRQVNPALAARELSEARHRRAERDAMPDSDERRLISEAANRAIAGRRVRDINPNVYRVAEARASRLAFEAAAKKDYTEAYMEKRKQLLNHELYRAASAAKLEAGKIREAMRKFDEPKKRARLGKAGQAYLEQIDAIMERFDFRKISNRAADQRVALAAWVEDRRKQGLEVAIPEWMLNESLRMPWQNLTYEQLQGVRDAVVNIDHLARLKSKLLANKAGREFEAEVKAIVDSIDASHKRKPEAFEFAPSLGARIVQGMKRFAAEHTKMEFLFSWLDGEKNLGPAWEALFKPIADAEAQEQVMQRGAREALATIFRRYTGVERWAMFHRRGVVPGIGKSMNKATLLAVALNTGNAYNREVLLKGYKWSEGQLQAALSLLDDRDWETVQMIWDHLDSYWPEIKRLQQDLTGLAPEKVQAVPFQAPSGRPMAGGYYPIAYDSRLSWRQAELDQTAAVNELYGGGYMRVQTRHGHTIERTNSGGKAIKLDLGVMGTHVVNVIHDLTHRRALLDVDRLVTDDDVREAIEQTAGSAMYRQLRPWLKSIAADYRPDATVYEGIMNHLRAGGTVVAMGIKATTALVQPLGYFNATEFLGTKYAGIGLAEVFGRGANTVKSIAKAREFAFERSEQLRNRMHTFDRDVRDAIKGMSGMGEKEAAVRRAFFYFTGFMDMSVALPTWLGAYRKAMDGAADGIPAGDEPKAIDFADSVLRRTQSAGGAKDLAGIQGPNPLLRVFTVFYSYFNVLWNLFARRFKMMNFRRPADYPRFVGSMVALWFAPAVLSELIAGRGPDDDEDWDDYIKRSAMTWATYPLQSIAFVRDIVTAMGPYGYDGPPVVEAMEATGRTLALPTKAFDDDDELSRTDVKQALLAAGYWGHLPSRQMWITGSYLYDWSTGAENPETAAEALEGLAFPRQQ